jgi:hypothetical protein
VDLFFLVYDGSKIYPIFYWIIVNETGHTLTTFLKISIELKDKDQYIFGFLIVTTMNLLVNLVVLEPDG